MADAFKQRWFIQEQRGPVPGSAAREYRNIPGMAGRGPLQWGGGGWAALNADLVAFHWPEPGWLGGGSSAGLITGCESALLVT